MSKKKHHRQEFSKHQSKCYRCGNNMTGSNIEPLIDVGPEGGHALGYWCRACYKRWNGRR